MCRGPLGDVRDWVFRGKKKARGRGCVERVLMDSKQSPRVNRSCFSEPSTLGGICPRGPALRGRDSLGMPGTVGCLVMACTFRERPFAPRITNCEPFAARLRALLIPGAPPPFEALSGSSPSGPGKTRVPLQDAHGQERSISLLCDKGTCASDPSIILGEGREGEGSKSGEDPWKRERTLSQ